MLTESLPGFDQKPPIKCLRVADLLSRLATKTNLQYRNTRKNQCGSWPYLWWEERRNMAMGQWETPRPDTVRPHDAVKAISPGAFAGMQAHRLAIRWLTKSVCEMGGRGKHVENIEMLLTHFPVDSHPSAVAFVIPKLAVIKEVGLLLCSQSILCVEKKSTTNQGSSHSHIKWLLLERQVLEMCLLKWSEKQI